MVEPTKLGTCPNCGEVAPLMVGSDPAGMGPECRPCLKAWERYGRTHVGEAWCSVDGCWNEKLDDDDETCPAHV